jgi:hypothetical protein
MEQFEFEIGDIVHIREGGYFMHVSSDKLYKVEELIEPLESHVVRQIAIIDDDGSKAICDQRWFLLDKMSMRNNKLEKLMGINGD